MTELKRRRQNRLPVALPAEIHMYKDNTRLIAQGNVENLSLDGARVQIAMRTGEAAMNLFHVSRSCSLICALPDVRPPSWLWGDIAWVEVEPDRSPPNAHVGVCLTEILPSERFRLEDLLQRLALEA